MTLVSRPDAPWYSKLHIQIFIAMIVGALLGLTIGLPAARALGWLGTIFVRALNMVIVPLVFTSLTNGVASIGTGRELGRIGLKTLVYYMTTSLLAIIVGLFLVNIIRPGVGADISGAAAEQLPDIAEPSGPGDFALRLLLDFVPRNVVSDMAAGEMLGIIGFSIMLGVAIAHSPERIRDRGRTAFETAFQVMMVLTSFVIRLAPIGVLGLVTVAAARSGATTFVAMGKYAITITIGLLTHAFLTLPLVLIVLGRINPRIHYKNMAEPLITAFSTSSSSATLPVTLRTMEEKVGVSNRITSFVIPMGATVNMDGTALYECVGAIFICQVLGYPLDFATQVTIVITALAASIGAAGIPSAGLVMIFIILRAIGLTGPEPMVIVGTMLAIDRPLDMMRTAVNVLSDSCGAAIIARTEGEKNVDVEPAPGAEPEPGVERADVAAS
ncbi:MAG: dicarboxylate/amino acid:cation symporter [Candidatus Latescibacterota bacterium]|nr:MAG: dicarboxylate/amino acid:cation symporter [Candidatus Latescibacterota bacterium]